MKVNEFLSAMSFVENIFFFTSNNLISNRTSAVVKMSYKCYNYSKNCA